MFFVLVVFLCFFFFFFQAEDGIRDGRVTGVQTCALPIFNAAAGLGTSVVDGQVEPDEIRVSKRDGAVSCYRASAAADGRVLSDEQVRELSALIVRIEQHYHAPQDIEWCYDGTQFWIVQARPVTVSP